MSLDEATMRLLDESMEYLREHIGADARLIYDGEKWSVDAVAYPNRAVLCSSKNLYEATTGAVDEFYRRHSERIV